MKKQLLFLLALCLAAIHLFSQAPTISSFSPASGPVGTLVTITGTNLSSPTAFTIGAVSAIVVSDNGTTLTGMVMPGATTGTVSVTTAGGTATGSGSFAVRQTPYPSVQQGAKLVDSINASYDANTVALSADGSTAIVSGTIDTVAMATVYTRSAGIWMHQGELKGSAVSSTGITPQLGAAVALSADGNTAVIGGTNNDTGAIWIFTRSAGIWTQQGPPLIGTGAINSFVGINQGYSVGISADGNTVISGARSDNNNIGASWIFVRSGTTWSQQGNKLVGTGVTGGAGSLQGYSVALSADGNTAIVGGTADNISTGAVWIFRRSAGVWSQQGAKLVGTGAQGSANQGTSVAISADGNTVIEGGYYDNTGHGAAWVFTRSAGVWSQQGSKLVGTGAIGAEAQGTAVALSADGNTALIGGDADSSRLGAVWVYTRTGTTWTQRGRKLVGTGAIGIAYQGSSAALSADGTTAIEGGIDDNGDIGAAWVFAAACAPDSSAFTHSICQGDTFTFGSQHLTSSGTFSDTLTNAGGCDSIVTLYLTVNPPPVVTWVQDSFYCFGELEIPPPFVLGGTSPPGGIFSGRHVFGDTIIPVADSIYYPVTYTFTDSNGCSSAVNKTYIFTMCTGIAVLGTGQTIHLYPNPNTGSFILRTSQQQGAAYTISDMMGQMIQQQIITSDKQNIDVKNTPSGIYTLSISGMSGSVKFAIIR